MIKFKFFYLLVSVSVFFFQHLTSSANTVFITGGNSAIGLALVQKYLENGYDVIATYKDNSNSSELLNIKNDKLTNIKIDLRDYDTNLKIKKIIQNRPIDILINNACFFPHNANKITELNIKEWMDAFLVCSVQPIKISEALHDNIKSSKQKKIIMIGSRVSSSNWNVVGDKLLKYQNGYAYKSSKAALHSATISLAKDFQKDNIIITIIHPGHVNTKLSKDYKKTKEELQKAPRKDGVLAQIEPYESANMIYDIIDKLDNEHNMKFLNIDMTEIPF